MKEIIKQLCLIPGVSGDEHRVRRAIISLIDGKCGYYADRLGNLICFKQGRKRPKNKLMLSAHMDEVGFIVTAAGDDGILRFSAVGGVDVTVIPGKPVLIGDNGVKGVFGCKPVHLMDADEKERLRKPESLYIDIGAASREEALQYVNIGDRAVFDCAFEQMGAPGDLFMERVTARGLDDRAGCALLIDMISSPLEYDCHIVFTVNEETGSGAAAAAAYSINPDIAIIVETTTAADIGGVDKQKQVCALGAGPVLSFMDRGTVYDKELYDMAMRAAKRDGIKLQPKTGVFGGNESRYIQASGSGVRVMAVSLPCRYLHSPSSVLDMRDVYETSKLLKTLLSEVAAIGL